jgi:hypothetical protein
MAPPFGCRGDREHNSDSPDGAAFSALAHSAKHGAASRESPRGCLYFVQNRRDKQTASLSFSDFLEFFG